MLSALGNGRALTAVREMLHGFGRGGAEFASAFASLSALTLPRGLGGLGGEDGQGGRLAPGPRALSPRRR